MSVTHTGALLATFDAQGYMLTCPIYARHEIGSGTYMSGVGLGRLSLNSASDSDSDHLDD
jgi:hypothetical protein